MLVGHGGSFELNLFFLQAWPDYEALFQTLQRMMIKHELILLNKNYTVVEKRQVALAPEETDFIAFCRAEYRDDVSFPTQTADKLTIKIRPKFVLNSDQLLPAHQDVIILLGAFRSKDGFGQIWLSAEMSSRMSEYSKNPLYAEQVMALFVQIAESLAAELRPDYGWAAETDENMDKMPQELIQAKQPSRLFWGNYFGEGFLDSQREALVEQAPVGVVKRWPHGIWYQLHEQFESVGGSEVARVEAAVKSHFAPLNLELVLWKFEAA